MTGGEALRGMSELRLIELRFPDLPSSSSVSVSVLVEPSKSTDILSFRTVLGPKDGSEEDAPTSSAPSSRTAIGALLECRNESVSDSENSEELRSLIT